MRLGAHGCDPGRVSDSLRLALYQTFSISSALLLSFSGMHVLCVTVPFFLSFLSYILFCFVFMLSLELYR